MIKIVISGLGQTIYFNKKNINEKIKSKIILNNINEYLDFKNFELIGVRDLFYDDGFLYISLVQGF